MKNKPLNRNYFKYKDKPKKKDEKELTSCCGQSADHKVLNVNDKEDWKLIEDRIEEHLRVYSGVSAVTPVSCENCGRLLRYSSKLKQDKKHWR